MKIVFAVGERRKPGDRNKDELVPEFVRFLRAREFVESNEQVRWLLPDCPNGQRPLQLSGEKNFSTANPLREIGQFILNDGTGQNRTILSGIKDTYTAEELVGKTLVAITNLPPRKMMGQESCGMLLSAVCEHDGEELDDRSEERRRERV